MKLSELIKNRLNIISLVKNMFDKNISFLKNSEIEIISDLPVPVNIKHAIFDHDGTISVLRCGWEEIMETVMLKAILGDLDKNSIDDVLYDEIIKNVRGYIDESTGIQTIIQMDNLVKMVREFKLVPEDKVLNKFEYKAIYNQELLKLVNKRICDLRIGKKKNRDFVLNGAMSFLKLLNRRGVKLYLVSGTDNEDVLNEAEILGYKNLFNGGIFGSLNDIKKFSKKIIIENVIRANNLKGEELLVVGDGPVEMKESRKVNGISIGVASDEVRMKGINRRKRERLIGSGAHIIIPDFLEADCIMNFLFGEK